MKLPDNWEKIKLLMYQPMIEKMIDLYSIMEKLLTILILSLTSLNGCEHQWSNKYINLIINEYIISRYKIYKYKLLWI